MFPWGQNCADFSGTSKWSFCVHGWVDKKGTHLYPDMIAGNIWALPDVLRKSFKMLGRVCWSCFRFGMPFHEGIEKRTNGICLSSLNVPGC